MYHEQTDERIARRRRNRIVAIIIAVLIVIAIVAAFLVAQANAREQAATALQQSIVDSAKQCCAVEGSYPSSLEYLEENYGLVVNSKDFVITYEWFADNILPSVSVVPR